MPFPSAMADGKEADSSSVILMKRKYILFISANLSEHEEERLLKVLRKHRAAIGYTLDDLKGISPTLCQQTINMEPDAKPVVDHQRRLNPKMKEVLGT